MPASPNTVSWDPQTYLAFAEARERPAIDLINRINLIAPTAIFDLGCGTGAVTRMLGRRWPHARVTGIDSSDAMLAQARATDDAIRWDQADIGAWRPQQPADLIVSNAALHWLDGHDVLFPRLVGTLNAGGVLAVQMPGNFHAPSHRAIAETAADERWRNRLAPLVRERPVHTAQVYLDLLSPLSSSVEIWETTYWHVLTGDNPVVEWTRGTALRPFLQVLEDDERTMFLREYAERIAASYPPRPDGSTLFPFRRLFMVATR